MGARRRGDDGAVAGDVGCAGRGAGDAGGVRSGGAPGRLIVAPGGSNAMSAATFAAVEAFVTAAFVSAFSATGSAF